MSASDVRCPNCGHTPHPSSMAYVGSLGMEVSHVGTFCFGCEECET